MWLCDSTRQVLKNVANSKRDKSLKTRGLKINFIVPYVSNIFNRVIIEQGMLNFLFDVKDVRIEAISETETRLQVLQILHSDQIWHLYLIAPALRA